MIDCRPWTQQVATHLFIVLPVKQMLSSYLFNISCKHTLTTSKLQWTLLRVQWKMPQIHNTRSDQCYPVKNMTHKWTLQTRISSYKWISMYMCRAIQQPLLRFHNSKVSIYNLKWRKAQLKNARPRISKAPIIHLFLLLFFWIIMTELYSIFLRLFVSSFQKSLLLETCCYHAVSAVMHALSLWS